MSRSYRVSVSESLRTVLKAEDRVSTQLELLEVLLDHVVSDGGNRHSSRQDRKEMT